MEFTQFFKSFLSFFQNQKQSVFLLTGSVYPQSFFSYFFEFCKKNIDIEIKPIDIQSNDSNYKASLATTFLGMQCVYWIGDLSSLKAKQKDEFIKYLMQYEGPHKIIAFIDNKFDQEKNSHIYTFLLKDKYFIDDAKGLWTTSDLQQAQKHAFFLQQIYKIKNSYSLDELFLLKNYQDLIAADSKEFYDTWIPRLIVPDASLFTLSQFLFEKKEEAFFKIWLTTKDLYSEMFWISFWSDQLYRAYFYIVFTQENNFIAAKQVSFGLPFSFLKQTYKTYDIQELYKFHTSLYAVDIALKSGGTLHQIDEVLLQFFIGFFKQ